MSTSPTVATIEMAIHGRAIAGMSRLETIVIDAFRNGDLATKAAMITGMSVPEAEAIYLKYQTMVYDEQVKVAKELQELKAENQSLHQELGKAQNNVHSLTISHQSLTSENAKLKENWWEKSSWIIRIIAIILIIISIRAVLNPVTHRLSPDICRAEDENSNRIGRVTGFHYEKRTWWGFRKTIYYDIKFTENGPQYLDGEKWRYVPDEAWGVATDVNDQEVVEYYR